MSNPRGRPRRPLADRLWSKVDVREPDECWPWLGSRISTGVGYGQVGAGGGDGKNLTVHRVAWELVNGPIPEGTGYHGTCVCHRCDNPVCANPAHLFLGTTADNMADRNAKGRQARGERSGRAKLNAEQVAEIRGSVGTLKTIAAQYGVTFSSIARIRRRETHL